LLQIARKKVAVLEPGLACFLRTPCFERMTVESMDGDNTFVFLSAQKSGMHRKVMYLLNDRVFASVELEKSGWLFHRFGIYKAEVYTILTKRKQWQH
jgi:hypothetical protein